jgi:FkbM family methyltransferase
VKNLLNHILSKIGYRIVRNSTFLSSNHLDAIQEVLSQKSNPIIFDVGAHHGETALDFQKRIPYSTIYSFEPFPDSFSILSRKTSSNKKIIVNNFGFLNLCSAIEFNSNVFSPTNSVLDFDIHANKTWNLSKLHVKEKIVCNFLTIDSFLTQENIHTVDLLKMDTQGSEYMILEGAKNAIKNRSIKNIYMEIIIGKTYKKQKSFGYYLNTLDKLGFELFGIYGLSHNKSGALIQVDALFRLRS